MSLPIKLGLAAVGAAGATTTAYYGGSYLFGSPENSQPDREVTVISWRPLVDDSEFLNASGTNQPKNEFANKYGADYARFLIGTGVDSQSDKPNNISVWDGIFENEYKNKVTTFEGGFKDLTAGAKTASANGKSIQEACDKVYKSDKDKIKGDGVAITVVASEFKESQVWTLCSLLDSKPKTISEAGESSTDKNKVKEGGAWNNKLGGNKKTDLMAIDDGSNNGAWKELNNQYQSEKPNTGFFKLNADGEDIKNKCENAYKQDETGNDDSKPTEADLYKWCSLKGYKAS